MIKNILIGVVLSFVLFAVFSNADIITGAVGEPNYVLQEMPNIVIPYDGNVTDIPITETIGKITYYGHVIVSELPQPNELGRDVAFPISLSYDIYSTGDSDDVTIFETYFTAYAFFSISQNAYILNDVSAYIPYSVEYLFTAVTRGYSAILDALRTEFRQGFPTLPSGDADVIDYVVYIGRGLFHSVTSVAITFDFIVFPINIMRGAFI